MLRAADERLQFRFRLKHFPFRIQIERQNFRKTLQRNFIEIEFCPRRTFSRHDPRKVQRRRRILNRNERNLHLLPAFRKINRATAVIELLPRRVASHCDSNFRLARRGSFAKKRNFVFLTALQRLALILELQNKSQRVPFRGNLLNRHSNARLSVLRKNFAAHLQNAAVLRPDTDKDILRRNRFPFFYYRAALREHQNRNCHGTQEYFFHDLHFPSLTNHFQSLSTRRRRNRVSRPRGILRT